MKNLIQYRYTCENAIFNYLKDNNLNTLISEIIRCENHYKEENNIVDENINIWFRFSSDDTLATTTKDIISDLNLPVSHPNHKLLIEKFSDVIKLEPEYELQIYVS